MKKRFITVIIICFIVGLVTSAMAFVAFYGTLRDSLSENATRALEYVFTTYDAHNSLPADLAKTVKDNKDVYFQTAYMIESVCVYDKSNERLTGDTDLFPEDLDPGSDSVHMSYDVLCTPYEVSDTVTLWLINSNENIKDTCFLYLKRFIYIFILSFAVICVVMALLLRLADKRPEATKLIYITVFVWVMIMCTVFIIGMMRADMETQSEYIDSRIDDIEADVEYMNSLTDDYVNYLYDRHLTKAQREEINSDSVEEIRKGFVSLEVEYDNLFRDSSIQISIGDNILDTSLPISERVDVTQDIHYYLKVLMDYILQAIMIGIFGTIVLHQVLSKHHSIGLANVERPEGIEDELFSKNLRNLQKVSNIIILKYFSETLVTVYAVFMLQDWLENDYGDDGSRYVTGVIVISGILGFIGVYTAPHIYRMCGAIMRYIRVSIGVGALGAFLCFFAVDSRMFVAGYLITIIGDSFTCVLRPLYAAAHETDVERRYGLDYLDPTDRTGCILGSVAGGILGVIFGGKAMYLIAAVSCVGIILYTRTVQKEARPEYIPENTGNIDLFRNRNTLLFFLLIVIPGGFHTWFFDYQVALDASEIGLTAVVISFIFFMRSAFESYMEDNKNNSNMLGRFPLGGVAAVCVLISAVGFFAYFRMNSHSWALIGISLLIAYMEASMDEALETFNVRVLGYRSNIMFGSFAELQTGSQFCDTAAPVIVETVGPLVIPVIMLAGGAGFLAHQIFYKKDPASSLPSDR